MDTKTCLRWFTPVAALACLVVACVSGGGPEATKQHLWWAGLGRCCRTRPSPGDCTLCHVGTDWQTLTADFQFDHEKETGVPLIGAHASATCLRCHNDRGPVAVFAQEGCSGCHEDIHLRQLGTDCEQCHQQQSWEPVGMIERHQHTRFPLTGVHLSTSCYRCHPGAEVGKFVPTDVECLTCHTRDLNRATNPNHIGLGWVDRCDRCHMPRTWNEAEIHN
jgi:hypothetical protein